MSWSKAFVALFAPHEPIRERRRARGLRNCNQRANAEERCEFSNVPRSLSQRRHISRWWVGRDWPVGFLRPTERGHTVRRTPYGGRTSRRARGTATRNDDRLHRSLVAADWGSERRRPGLRPRGARHAPAIGDTPSPSGRGPHRPRGPPGTGSGTAGGAGRRGAGSGQVQRSLPARQLLRERRTARLRTQANGSACVPGPAGCPPRRLGLHGWIRHRAGDRPGVPRDARPPGFPRRRYSRHLRGRQARLVRRRGGRPRPGGSRWDRESGGAPKVLVSRDADWRCDFAGGRRW